MSRNTEYKFVPEDAAAIDAALVASYETLTGISMQPASPEKLIDRWITAVLVQERILSNYTGNQNIPSRAEGKNLDALAELFYDSERPAAKAATCMGRFCISGAQASAILVPAGTRVTDLSGTMIWETADDAYIPAGETSTDIQLRCRTPGSAGNGYTVGQISRLIDLYDYCSRVENITESGGGSDEATDEEFYELLRLSMDGYSCAGARGGYIYWAKQVSTEIADVVANTPNAGEVAIYALMRDGEIAGEETKTAILTACSADERRPLTDLVTVADPETVEYDIAFTYYIDRNTTLNSADIISAVEKAVTEYVSWQHGKLGRDLNPDKLREYLIGTGIKRIVLTSPEFTVLRDGKDNTVPQIARLRNKILINGGFEDE